MITSTLRAEDRGSRAVTEDAMHSVLVPELACSARLYDPLLTDA